MAILDNIPQDSRLSFIISGDQDSDVPFFKAFEIIKMYLLPEAAAYGGGFFDSAKGYFIKDGITVHLEYSNWSGTELYVENTCSDLQVEKIKSWVNQIIDKLNKQ